MCHKIEKKSVTSWFLGQGDFANNDRHAHFITRLEICESLELNTSQAAKSDATQLPAPAYFV
jgi:hypothetical protein